MGGRFKAPGVIPLILFSDVPNSASAVAHIIDSSTNFTTPGAKLLSVRSAGSEKACIDKDGRIWANGGLHVPYGAMITTNPSDAFVDDGVTVPNYGMTWAMPQSGGAFGYLSGYSGVRIYTAGGKQVEFNQAGTQFTEHRNRRSAADWQVASLPGQPDVRAPVRLRGAKPAQLPLRPGRAAVREPQAGSDGQRT